MSRYTGPSQQIVQAIIGRSTMFCEAGHTCGAKYLSGERGYAWSVHHRRSRGMGGSKAPAINLPANLLVVCGSGTTGCHGFLEANPLWAFDNGLRIHTLPQRLTVPIDSLLHGRVLLDDNAGWTYFTGMAS